MVQGTVTDRTTGLPIANASVYWGSYNGYNTPLTTTDANGNYNRSPLDRYTTRPLERCRFVAAGYYIPAVVGFTVSSGATTTVSATMLPEPAVLVQGTVTDAYDGSGDRGRFSYFSDLLHRRAAGQLLWLFTQRLYVWVRR